MSFSTVPSYVNAANTVASGLYNMGFSRTAAIAAIGACVGSEYGQPATYAVQVTMLDLFWKYAVPNTFGKIFFHRESNVAANILGAGLSFITSFSIPYLCNRLVSYISKDTPYIGRLAKEADNDLPEYKGIGKTSILALGIIALRRQLVSALPFLAAFPTARILPIFW